MSFSKDLMLLRYNSHQNRLAMIAKDSMVSRRRAEIVAAFYNIWKKLICKDKSTCYQSIEKGHLA